MKKFLQVTLLAILFIFLPPAKNYAAPGDTTIAVSHTGVQMSYTGNYDGQLILPDTNFHSYRKIYLHYILGRYVCPGSPQYCGSWDYLTSVYILPFKHSGDSVELARVITPYASNWSTAWTNECVIDITDYAPLLKDSSAIRVNYGGYSYGFTVTIKFEFIKGTPPRDPVSVKNIYSSRTHGTYWYGGTPSINAALPQRPVTMASPATNAMVRVVATGHGSDNNGCSEFCSAYYKLLLNNVFMGQRQVWRDNCGRNDLYPQTGTWVFQRANWCPGAKVLPFDHELTSFMIQNTTYNVNLDWQAYTTPNGGPNYVIEAQFFSFKSPNFNLDASLEEIKAPNKKEAYYRSNPICSNPVVVIRNTGSTTLTSLKITYGIRGGIFQTYTWNGNLPFLQTAEVVLPAAYTFFPALSQTNYDVSISSPNGGTDQYADNNKLSSSFNYPYQYPNKIIIKMKTNASKDTISNLYSETNWRIINDQGVVVASRLNNPINTILTDTVMLPAGCYTFDVTDQGCDGINWWFYAYYTVNPGTGFIQIRNGYTPSFLPLIRYSGGDFGCGFTEHFTVGYYMDVKEDAVPASLEIYPNPSAGSFTVDYALPHSEDVILNVYSMVGSKVFSRKIEKAVSNTISLDLSNLEPGVYLFEMGLKDSRIMRRIVISR